MNPEQQVVPVPDPWVLIALTVLAALMTAIYNYYCIQAWDDWRDFRDLRSFRAFIASLVLALGMWTILLGTISTAFFAEDELVRNGLRFIRTVLYGSIIVGGISLVSTWRRSRPKASK